MLDFQHIGTPHRIYCGADSLQRLAKELDRLGCRRAVVFCGATLARRDDGLPLVQAALGDRFAGLFDGVEAHSPLPAVLAGVDVLRQAQADAVIALGGGSAVVTARASAILLAENRDIHELCTRYAPGRPPHSPRLLQPKLPQLIVPTTPTTAYAKAGTAVVDPALGQRVTLFDPKTRPYGLFIHPQLALTAPASLALDAAVQAYAMAVQGLEARQRDPLADGLLIHALSLLTTHLPGLQTAADDADVRIQLMLGAFLAGYGTDYAPPGLASALTHCIGARFHLANGTTNALMLPHTVRYNAPATGGRLRVIPGVAANTLEQHSAAAAADVITRLFASLGLPARLRDVGVAEQDLAQIAADAFGDWFLHQNPRAVAGPDELRELLAAAW